MPLLLLAGLALLAAFAGKGAASSPSTPELDANLTPAARQAVEEALTQSTPADAYDLCGFAAALTAAGYPLSAKALAERSAQLSGRPC